MWASTRFVAEGVGARIFPWESNADLLPGPATRCRANSLTPHFLVAFGHINLRSHKRACRSRNHGRVDRANLRGAGSDVWPEYSPERVPTPRARLSVKVRKSLSLNNHNSCRRLVSDPKLATFNATLAVRWFANWSLAHDDKYRHDAH
jgi:hypothetical protein